MGSGDNIDYGKLKAYIRNADLVIAVDGGYNYIRKVNEKCDILIGDLDSINNNYLKDGSLSKTKKIKFPSEKNSTDMELAIEEARKLKVEKMIILGATGYRMDHSLANILLLKKLYEYNIEGYIEDYNNRIYFIKDKLRLKANCNNLEYVSVIPISLSGAVVSLEGFKYPLDKFKIEFTKTIGISNEIKDNYGLVKIHEGEVLVYVSKD